VTTTLARMIEEWHDEVPVARVEGEVDASNVHEMGDRLRSLLTNRSVALVVDLTATTYLDSAGLNLLFALGEELRRRQQQLGLVVAERSPIARMVGLVGLDKSVPVHPTVAEALARAGESFE
jgi:anti-anti-sigma factor